MKLRRITQAELNKILENHKHWLNEDIDGWEDMKADLNYLDLSYFNLDNMNLSDVNLKEANLTGVDLRCTNLTNANLIRVNLSKANLSNADLTFANLTNADLRDTNLRVAQLRCANLSYANLSYANLEFADLSHTVLSHAFLIDTILENTNLSNAHLAYADLTNADLSDTILENANLRGIKLTYAKNIPFVPYACPSHGSFIAFKKAGDFIIVLEIPEDAKRLSATSRKCRCDKAKVLEIQELDGTKTDLTEIRSDFDSDFIYRVGEIVTEPNFDEDRWNECSRGIHFFINREEAVQY